MFEVTPKRINFVSPSQSSAILLKLSLTTNLNLKYVIYNWNIASRYIVIATNTAVKFGLETYLQNKHHP